MTPPPTWLTDLQRSGDVAGQRCANETSPPPHTAFCIAGAARSFAAPLIQEALWHHLVRAFGSANSSKFFFLLKTEDSDKHHERPVLGALNYDARHVSAEPLEKAVRRWEGRVAEAWIVHGSGSLEVNDDDSTQRSPIRSTRANATAWLRYRAACVHAHQPAGARNESRDGGGGGGGNKPGASSLASRKNPRDSYLAEGNNEQRLILHHLGLRWCRTAIEKHEITSSRRFEIVIFARPDLWHAQGLTRCSHICICTLLHVHASIGHWQCHWQCHCTHYSLVHALSVVHRWHYRPAVPWCELKPRDGVHVCASAACDTMFVAGREYAMPLLDQARQHRDCASGAVSIPGGHTMHASWHA